MKYQLNKTDRNRQKRLAAAIRKGLPLTGLLALLPLAGGCDEGTAPLSGAVIAPEQSTDTVIVRGDIDPAPLAGVPPRPPTEPSAESDEESR